MERTIASRLNARRSDYGGLVWSLSGVGDGVELAVIAAELGSSDGVSVVAGNAPGEGDATDGASPEVLI